MQCPFSDIGLVCCWTEGGVDISAGDIIVVIQAIMGTILESPFFLPIMGPEDYQYCCSSPEGKLSLQDQVLLSDSSGCHLCQEAVSGVGGILDQVLIFVKVSVGGEHAFLWLHDSMW